MKTYFLGEKLVAILIICGATFGVYKGYQIVRFSLLEEQIQQLIEQPVRDRDEQPVRDRDASDANQLRERLSGWTDVSGLAIEARAKTIALRQLIIPGIRFDLLEGEVINWLSSRPMSGVGWMMLTEARLFGGAPLDTILAAYQMSMVTGPKEASTLLARVDLGFRLWEVLPSTIKDQVAGEFLVGQQILDMPDEKSKDDRIRGIIAAKNASVRLDMRTHIETKALGPVSWLTRYGLR